MSQENEVDATVMDTHQLTNEVRKRILAPDQVIACDTGDRYLVEKCIGEGRYGEVYKVCLTREPETKFAMKIADNYPNFRRLKTEALIYEEIASSAVEKAHFLKMYHHGRTATLRYYLMNLTAITLDELIGTKLSPSTLIQVARQTLQGIEALHDLGYMHRDIGPWYFAIGMPPKDHVVFMIDFGAARSFKQAGASSRAHFAPSSRYASIAAMEGQDPVRKDDIVAWSYMIYELYNKKNLPWRELKDAKSILKAKQDQQKNWPSLTKARTLKLPAHFDSINTWIMKGLKASGPVDFAFIYGELTKTAEMEKINETAPLDWVAKRLKQQKAAVVDTLLNKEDKKVAPPRAEDELDSPMASGRGNEKEEALSEEARSKKNLASSRRAKSEQSKKCKK